MIELSVIIPAYNEEAIIEQTVTDVILFLQKRNLSYEIVLVNDGSHDATQEKLLQLQTAHQGNIKLLQLPTNQGKGRAIQEGVYASEGALLLYMDADHSVTIEHLDVFYPYAQTCDIVIGSIGDKSECAIYDDNHPIRRSLGTYANILIRHLTGLPFKDTQRGFKLFKKTAAQTLFESLTTKRWGFDIEILLKAQRKGFLVQEVPVAWNNRRSSLGIGDYLHTLVELVKIKYNDTVHRDTRH